MRLPLDGRGNCTVDTIAVAADDHALTIVARVDFLDEESLRWLASRAETHYRDCTARSDPYSADVFRAIANLCNARISQ